MSVRKRILPRSGDLRWYVDYKDLAGKRRARQFKTRSEALQFETKMRSEIVAGTHVPDTQSCTLADACALWLQRAELEGLEPATIKQYREHVNLHIVPSKLGLAKLSRLTTPMIEAFKDELLATRSRPLSRAILGSLKAAIKEAQRRGLAGHNAAAGTQIRTSSRHEDKVEIPSKEHIRALLAAVPDQWRPLIVTALFTGLRCSELRGLIWEHVDLKAATISVHQRADYRGTMGPPKSRAGRRDVPLGPHVLNTLRVWKLSCSPSALGLVFPGKRGGVVTNGTIHRSCWAPLQRACGLVDEAGRPLYTFHSLRHAAASLFIEQGFTVKRLQTVMGHSTVAMSLDTYGHLFPSLEDDRAAMAQIEARILG